MTTARLPVILTLSPIEALPEAPIQGAGVVSRAFLDRGVRTFRDACRWVHALPYGCHAGVVSSLIIFEERRGNCLSKHGAIARLAGELDLDVHKHVGFYRLTDAIVTGMDALLAPHGLPFIPQMHCFLQHGAVTVDLTEGNRTGKNGDLDTFDFIVPVAPESPRDELQRLYVEHLERYAAIEPRLATMDRGALVALITACNRELTSRCEMPAALSA